MIIGDLEPERAVDHLDLGAGLVEQIDQRLLRVAVDTQAALLAVVEQLGVDRIVADVLGEVVVHIAQQRSVLWRLYLAPELVERRARIEDSLDARFLGKHLVRDVLKLVLDVYGLMHHAGRDINTVVGHGHSVWQVEVGT